MQNWELTVDSSETRFGLVPRVSCRKSLKSFPGNIPILPFNLTGVPNMGEIHRRRDPRGSVFDILKMKHSRRLF